MPFELASVVPWGRSFDEYLRMFTLSDADLRRRIVACADGPASFNAEAARRGLHVRSCDPLYCFGGGEIARRIEATFEEVIAQTRRNQRQFVWDRFRDVDELGRARKRAMQAFLADYDAGGREGRYVPAELPALPFITRCFDLALCSHFLFLYSSQLDARFHIESMLEMLRVADEARVFPLVSLAGEPSPHVVPVREALRSAGFEVSIERVEYEFQRGGNEMMRVSRVS